MSAEPAAMAVAAPAADPRNWRGRVPKLAWVMLLMIPRRPGLAE